jgi:hypothetical protein
LNLANCHLAGQQMARSARHDYQQSFWSDASDTGSLHAAWSHYCYMPYGIMPPAFIQVAYHGLVEVPSWRRTGRAAHEPGK